jgi:hypothetical protein
MMPRNIGAGFLLVVTASHTSPIFFSTKRLMPAYMVLEFHYLEQSSHKKNSKVQHELDTLLILKTLFIIYVQFLQYGNSVKQMPIV